MDQAIRINDLIDSLGIDTHINYTDGKYSDVGKVVSSLQYLGLDTVRDQAPNPANDPYGQGHLNDAAAAGVKFVFSAQREVDPAVLVQRIHTFVQAHPGSVVGIEGPNEVNNWPVQYQGLTGQAAAVAYQQAMFDAVNADPLLKNIPILGFTGYTVASANDYTTIHTYAKEGDQPFSWLSRESSVQEAADTGKPLAITETGYHTSLTADTNGGWEGVDEATQAKLLLNTLMDGAALGSKETFLYELLDAYEDPQGSDQEKHFGLFRLDYSPKPAATAIHNLTAILADNGANNATFTPGTLNYTITGLPSTAHSYLTAKSDGSYQIVVWNEPDIWDQNADKAISAAPVSIGINLGASFGSVEVYDPLTGTSSIKSLSNVSSLTLDAVDHPLVINLANAASGGGTPVDPPVTPPVTPPVDPTPAANHFYGGTGNDNFVVSDPTDIVDESHGGGTDRVTSSISFSLADTAHAIGDIENLTLSGSANINATGNALANILTGNSGNNILDGGTGADRMVGGAGDDTYIIDNTGDVASETGGSGNDTIKSWISFSLADKDHAPGAMENLTLLGTANLDATGNNLANVLTGNSGDNHLDGMKGDDRMIGGFGNDSYVVDSAGDIVDETGGGGTDTVTSSVTFSLAGSNAIGNIENLTLSGSGAINATGNDLANVLTGNSGKNVLSGGLGNDTLIGGGGQDTLTGGGGADRFVFDTKPNNNKNVDVVTDFSHSAGDKLALDHQIFSALDPSHFSAENFVVGTRALESDDFLIYNPTTGILSYDADGSGRGAAVQVAEFTNLTVVQFNDFVIF